MNKVRVVVIEAEGADASVVRSILEAMGGARVGVAVACEPAREAAPVAAAAPRELAAPRTAKARKAAPRAAAPAAPATAADGSTRAAVLAALAKRPMTSGEVIKATGRTASAIYGMLDYLRKEGTVETRLDEESAQRKNYLVAE